ncbi:MAG: DUF493 domain-containing protein [Sulfurospirillum sp.]|nr:DUF493 domain-containing protein [Sulfurospirillum sp.]MBL0703187.1 DUF493 domain-containing protein [Sulfurospirillum sp.]
MAGIAVNLKELKIDYPCRWEYKIVLESNLNIEKITKSIFKNKEYSIKKSNTSKAGKYQSYTVASLVNNNFERKTVFEELKNHKSIKFVL